MAELDLSEITEYSIRDLSWLAGSGCFKMRSCRPTGPQAGVCVPKLTAPPSGP